MAQVTVDADWHVEIPKEVRRDGNVQVGQKLSVVAKGGVISLLPTAPAESLRGLAKGEAPTDHREKTDRVW